MKIIFFLVAVFLIQPANADCVFGAKSKDKFMILDDHSVMLRGGYGNDIIVKTYAYLNRSSDITILKDSFCDFESAVLYVNGEVVNANEVKSIPK